MSLLTPIPSPARALSRMAPHHDLTVEGELNATSLLCLRGEVARAVEDHPAIVLLDVSAVTKITPSGVAGMLDLLRIARSAGGDFRVHGESPVLASAHSALRLTMVIAVYPTRLDALEAAR
ncbi:STAS domain-containing protein [Lacisediminihabitans changchengi]|uniref:STAS domain-containing protein n=1 Tax=Lacisediminihabitans changchengi TaxID=2787634 RepID=A0A934W2W0_9MICO|nr:STAS domain-containing protein [Lacisediminihabitans changchengi]MBK4347251.1 STAS domain-containing protein [Lacisediminihabitans changchengi]